MPTSHSERGLVSIVIPTFNQCDYLSEALECVQHQTYKSWHAIVVNNFSSDRTESVVRDFDDPRITLVNFANEGVIARSRNKAIGLARGEFVAFLDSDDLWMSTKIERSVEILQSGSDLVCHAERWFGGGSADRIVKYGPASRATYESLLFRGNCISTSATVMRRSVLHELGGFRDQPDFVTTEDYDLWLRTARGGYKIAFIDEVLGSFRRHLSSASSSTKRHLAAEIAVIENHMNAFQATTRLMRRRRIGLAYYSAGRAYSKSGAYGDGLKMFLIALTLNPFSLRIWGGLSVHLGQMRKFHKGWTKRGK